MKRAQRRRQTWGVVVLGVMVSGVLCLMVGLVNTLARVSEITVAKTPEAILASARIDESKTVRLPVMYYDQRMDECVNIYDVGVEDALNARQFEWSMCGYDGRQLEQGLVDYELDDQYFPVALGGKLTPNQGIDMARWYNAEEGKSIGYAGVLGLTYHSDSAEFSFDANEFYPLDDVDFSVGDITNKDGHNHLFTMNFAVPFTVLASGNEGFSVRADDDTFVYIDDKLAIDMGGIHDAEEGRFAIRENGEVYTGIGDEDLAYSGINVVANEGVMVRVFHADRDSKNSVFGVKFVGMDLGIIDSELADADGVQIAYDPSDPTFIPPLGESAVFHPDVTRALILLAVVEGVAILVATMIAMYTVRYLLRCKR